MKSLPNRKYNIINTLKSPVRIKESLKVNSNTFSILLSQRGSVFAESTKGEWMKHVPYRGSFQTRLPTEQPHTVGLMAIDYSAYLNKA